MNALADLMRRVSEAGGTIRLEGEMLRLSASEPLPDHLRTRLRQHKPEIVALLSTVEPIQRAAPIADNQACQDFPAEVAGGIGAILAADGARGVPPNRWPQIQPIRISWSSVDGYTPRSTTAGSRPTCSGAIRGRRGTGSIALASSC